MKNNIINKVNFFIFRCLIVAIIFLILGILCKSNNYYKENIYNNIYNNNLSFSFFKGIYNKYLSKVIPLYNIKEDTLSVFNEDIKFNNYSDYFDGVKLEVGNDYLVPSINKGVIVYIGNKEKYGNVIIMQDENGIDNWYGNICNINYKLYDNIDKGSYLGESCNDYIYLIFSKDNNFLNYKDYFKV